ncbi:MAG: sigma-70 family RNA polymerase sigma factor [Bacteroidaceae bacterium]|nr:sigma-70 family RNA polymerase sigma factor [Bacteroidaceae bacterium]
MRRTFLSEKELVQGCIRRDRDAQQELYARFAARLYTLCLRYIGDSDESRDLMHDSMIKAMDSIRSFRNEADGSLYSWLRRITVNVVFDRLRQNRRFMEVPLEQVSDNEMPDASDSDAGPERKIPDDVLKQIMATLSPVRRAVFNMYYIDGFSHKEIARALNITEGGSTSILAKARASVRKAITDYLKATGQ